MIGHELTAKYNIDHARTLAIVLPAMLKVRREAKRAKLLQYADRVWGICEGSEAVSYTHLDVYKRQRFFCLNGIRPRKRNPLMAWLLTRVSTIANGNCKRKGREAERSQAAPDRGRQRR